MINFFKPQLLPQHTPQKTTSTLFASTAPPATDMEAYFLRLSQQHFLRHGRKITKEKYYAAWVQSMTATLSTSNINQQSFFNQLLCNIHPV